MSASIAFKKRNSSDLLNVKLAQIARESSKFDVHLVSADGKIVRAHRLILAMYSKFLRRLLSNSSPEKKIIVQLMDFPFCVLEKVVELFYHGEIRVITAIKGKVYKALAFLEVDVPDIPPPRQPTKSKSSPLLDDEQIDLDPKNANEVNEVRQVSELNGQQQPPPQPQLQQKSSKSQQQQQKDKRTPNTAVSTETTTLRTDELKEKDCINNTESNAHVKSVLATDDTIGLDGKASHEMAVIDSTAIGNGAVSLDGEIIPGLLYGDNFGDDMDELEKTVKDLCSDIGLNTKRPNHGETEHTQ